MLLVAAGDDLRRASDGSIATDLPARYFLRYKSRVAAAIPLLRLRPAVPALRREQVYRGTYRAPLVVKRGNGHADDGAFGGWLSLFGKLGLPCVSFCRQPSR